MAQTAPLPTCAKDLPQAEWKSLDMGVSFAGQRTFLVTGSFVPENTEKEQCISIKTHASSPSHARAVLNIAGVQLRTTGNNASYELTVKEHDTGLGVDRKPTVYFKTARSSGSRITRINFEFAIVNNSEGALVFATKSEVTAVAGKVTAVESKVAAVECKVAAVEGKVAAVESKVAAVEGKVAAVESKVAAVEGKVTAVNGRVDTIDGAYVPRNKTIAIAQEIDIQNRCMWVENPSSDSTVTLKYGCDIAGNQGFRWVIRVP
jgi:hypothetical protein